MGVAPSQEILQSAPFCSPHGGARQIALVPFVKEFFPSPDCPLFRQLYAARMDPSVRYYMRNEVSDLRQERMPPIMYSPDELYRMYSETAEAVPMFRTNAELRATVESGGGAKIQPLPCTVVFLYEGATHVPEDSVRLSRDRDAFVKVIGGLGDASCVFKDAPLRRDYFHVQMFITKSAGDHNMGRVALLAAYVYHHHCIDLIGLRELPLLPTVTISMKTNIPFLCFLRELRDRTQNILAPPEHPVLWLDDSCVRGTLTAEYARKVCVAFATHFMEFAEAKAAQRAAKQLRRLAGGLGGGSSSGSGGDGSALAIRIAGPAVHASVAGSSAGSDAARTMLDSTGERGGRSLGSANASAASPHIDSGSGEHGLTGESAKVKVMYAVRGYLTGSHATLVAQSDEPNEVYVVCANCEVRVVAPVAGTPRTALERGISAVPKARAAEGDSSAPSADSCRHPDAAAASVAVCTFAAFRGDILSFTTDPELGATAAHGRWRADPHIFIENVLLSLVRDECRNAREADIDDPRWVRDEEKKCPVHDGSFYLWRFRRGEETFYYGTVPKFANPSKRRGGTVAVRGAQSIRTGMMSRNVSAVKQLSTGGTSLSGGCTNYTTSSDSVTPLYTTGSAQTVDGLLSGPSDYTTDSRSSASRPNVTVGGSTPPWQSSYGAAFAGAPAARFMPQPPWLSAPSTGNAPGVSQPLAGSPALPAALSVNYGSSSSNVDALSPAASTGGGLAAPVRLGAPGAAPTGPAYGMRYAPSQVSAVPPSYSPSMVLVGTDGLPRVSRLISPTTAQHPLPLRQSSSQPFLPSSSHAHAVPSQQQQQQHRQPQQPYYYPQLSPPQPPQQHQQQQQQLLESQLAALGYVLVNGQLHAIPSHAMQSPSSTQTSPLTTGSPPSRTGAAPGSYPSAADLSGIVRTSDHGRPFSTAGMLDNSSASNNNSISAGSNPNLLAGLLNDANSSGSAPDRYTLSGGSPTQAGNPNGSNCSNTNQHSSNESAQQLEQLKTLQQLLLIQQLQLQLQQQGQGQGQGQQSSLSSPYYASPLHSQATPPQHSQPPPESQPPHPGDSSSAIPDWLQQQLQCFQQSRGAQ